MRPAELVAADGVEMEGWAVEGCHMRETRNINIGR